MNNSESGMAKKNIVVRFLAFSLAAIMMLGAFAVVPVLSVESEPEVEQSQSAQNNSEIVYDEDVLSITVDGEERTELEIYENEKVTIKAEGVLAAKYQWQILHPERSGLWVDIYEETKATLDVSLALTSNMEQEDGKTYLRCLAYEAEGAYVTDVLEVATLEGTKPIDAPEIPQLETGKVDYNLVQADGVTPEFVTITIKYEKYEYQYSMEDDEYILTHMGTAFSSYQATIQYGADFSTSVNSPTIVGFDPYYRDPATDQETVTKTMNIALTNVQEDVIYTINYKPAKVKYEVHYYFQNVYDDLYVEDESVAKDDGIGETGLKPEEGIDEEFEGFTALYYHPDVIAADGSTVFEVYYERNYYLMEFDCDGGFGVHTIYVRHGTYVSIATPTKPGYVFDGWDLVKTEDLKNPPSTSSPIYDDENNIIGYNTEDGVEDTLPSEMPIYNTAYKALWTTEKTTYTVVYWRENADDSNYSYWGSAQKTAMSATTVSGSDDAPTSVTNAKIDGQTVNEKPYFTYNNELTDKNILVEGDGSTIVNVYYDRKIFTLEFSLNNLRTFNPPAVHATHDGNNCVCNKKHLHNDDCEKIALICGKTEHKAHTSECIDCGKTEHKHNNNCYSCGKTEHVHSQANGCGLNCKHVHDATCYGGASTISISNNYRNAINDIGTNNPQSGYIYRITYSDWWGTVTEYYLYYDNQWYQVSENSIQGQSLGEGTYSTGGMWSTTYTANKYEAKECDHTHTDDCYSCNKEIHLHSAECGYKCSSEEHTHDDSCYDHELHTHVDACYEWSCGEDDHIHSAECCTKPITYVEGNYYYIKAKYDQTIASVWPTAENFPDIKLRAWDFDHTSTDFVSKRVNMTPELCDTNDYIRKGVGETTDSDTVRYLHYMFESFNQTNGPDGNDRKEYPNNSKVYYDKSDLYYQKIYGSTSLNAKEITGMEAITDSISSGNILFLYYKRNRVSFSFYNVNQSIETIDNIMYGTELENITHTVNGKVAPISSFIPPYPTTYEPGAYEFGGWYTTPNCYPGTEVDWDDMTMPNTKLEVYAKWTPIVRNVVFYKFYSDVSKGVEYAWHADPENPTKYPIPVPHGELLGTTYNHIPTINDGYKFIGWFYFDENGKKKFAPDSMKVTRDLDLFAEWYTTIPTTYEVKYEAWDEKTEEKIEEIAVKTEGYSTAGKTVTFMAKGSSALYDKKPPVSSSTTYRTNWFPTPSSHSILMQEDSALNTFTFKYYYKEYINYKIRYVDRSTGKILEESKVLQTSKAVETIKFKPFEGYLPEDYYIEKAIMYDPTDYNTYPDHVMEENIIYFYYNPDTEHAPFRIEHYQQDLDGENYTLAYTEQGISDLNQPKDAASREFKGYTYKPAKSVVITYKKVGDEWVENEPVSGTSGTVTLGGLIIRLYYDRNVVNYTINYIDAGSNTVMYTDSSKSGIFGSTVSEVAPGLHIYNGDTYYYIAGKDAEEIERTKSITIREKAEDNVIDFYYSIKTITIHYHKVCSVPDLDDLNGVSVANQKISKLDDSVNSTAMPGKGFQFKGWFYDEACTQPVPEANVVDNTIYPGVPNSIVVEDADGTEHFYALFEPVYGSLKLTKSAGTTENNESFLFHIKGKAGTVTGHIDMIVTITDSGSKILNKLPIGSYTVTEMESWSWTSEVPRNEAGELMYPIEQNVTVKESTPESTPVEILFGDCNISSDWLTGEKIDQDE